MWKLLATVAAGVIPGIFIGLAIAALFMTAPLRSQLKISQDSERKLTAQNSVLQGQLRGTNESVDEIRDIIQGRSLKNAQNIDDLRSFCRAENVRAVESTKAIERITRGVAINRQATEEVKREVASSCAPRELVPTSELRVAVGQQP